MGDYYTSQTFANSHFTKKNFYYSLQHYFTKVLVKLLKYAVAFNELCIAYANYSASIWILIFEWKVLVEKRENWNKKCVSLSF